MTNDLGVLAQIAHDAGIDPIDFAEEQVTVMIGVYQALQDVGSELGLPVATSEMTVGAVARRILGALLDAGWQPPVWPTPEPAQETS